ncbi:hypothetical protein CAPTEDRAFT_136138, partial [Capitella teleta]
IPLIPSDTPFSFKRLQLPVKLSFAMTINKSQGQTLNLVALNLEQPILHMPNYMWDAQEWALATICTLFPHKLISKTLYIKRLYNKSMTRSLIFMLQSIFQM